MKNKYFLLGLAALSIVACKKKEEPVTKSPVTMVVEEEPVDMRYGFNFEEFTVVQDTIERGQSFGELMIDHNADYPKVVKIANEFKDTFDVRKLQFGKPYYILKSRDSIESAQVFIYEQDRVNYTVVDLRDSVVAYRKQKPIKVIEREIAGEISNGSSLYLTLDSLGVDPNLTYEFSQIYAWQVDFWRIMPGDKFKLIIKEKYINDSIYVGFEPVQNAYFEHRGEPLYAFEYGQDSLSQQVEFYDQNAMNLRRAFLKAPVRYKNFRISSRYNLRRRISYYGNRIRPHKGTDFAAPYGTPIISTADGVVVESTRRGGNGKFVKIRHNGTYSTQYLHMSRRSVSVGQYVKQGQVIGYIGMTGNTSGPHVCYRFWKNGRQVDPLREKLPSAEPIAEELREGFLEYIVPIKARLDAIQYPIRPNSLEQEEPVTPLITQTQEDVISEP
ncbi:peptidoglycan DD-metalloendopeptidase family protein [Aureicoccus marinus]|jgi:murein DD-endopeptidase MepM/ murein hydrolase activator NlpD|uniref:Peptidase M23 n=1 Tax=Aureicoccus marinus TaxID=754435 RepID=A0A2S7TA54_9FLAO|nr:peptidoglycan DD-metalloendopeptidase family protein [Aureicoccus marinus]PQJ16375.1 peptidase M23 [Aureicoccus marinus]